MSDIIDFSEDDNDKEEVTDEFGPTIKPDIPLDYDNGQNQIIFSTDILNRDLFVKLLNSSPDIYKNKVLQRASVEAKQIKETFEKIDFSNKKNIISFLVLNNNNRYYMYISENSLYNFNTFINYLFENNNITYSHLIGLVRLLDDTLKNSHHIKITKYDEIENNLYSAISKIKDLNFKSYLYHDISRFFKDYTYNNRDEIDVDIIDLIKKTIESLNENLGDEDYEIFLKARYHDRTKDYNGSNDLIYFFKFIVYSEYKIKQAINNFYKITNDISKFRNDNILFMIDIENKISHIGQVFEILKYVLLNTDLHNEFKIICENISKLIINNDFEFVEENKDLIKKAFLNEIKYEKDIINFIKIYKENSYLQDEDVVSLSRLNTYGIEKNDIAKVLKEVYKYKSEDDNYFVHNLRNELNTKENLIESCRFENFKFQDYKINNVVLKNILLKLTINLIPSKILNFITVLYNLKSENFAIKASNDYRTVYFLSTMFYNDIFIKLIKLALSGANNVDEFLNRLLKIKDFNNKLHNIEGIKHDSFDLNFDESIDESIDDNLTFIVQNKFDLSKVDVRRVMEIYFHPLFKEFINDFPNNKKEIVSDEAQKIGIDLAKLINELRMVNECVNNKKITPEVKQKSLKIYTQLDVLSRFKYVQKVLESAPHKHKVIKQLNFKIDDYTFEVLPDKSIDHLTIGAFTDCCQRLGGAGQEAAIDSLKNPLAGVLVLYNNRKDIIAQSYFHYVPSDKGIILDNVETNRSLARNVDIDSLYANLALHLKSLGFNYVKCGINYNRLDNSKFGFDSMKKDPREFKVEKHYTDFEYKNHIDLTRPTFDFEKKNVVKLANNIIALIRLATLFRRIYE